MEAEYHEKTPRRLRHLIWLRQPIHAEMVLKNCRKRNVAVAETIKGTLIH